MIGRIGSTRASLITYLLPVVALVLGATINDDRVAPIALVGVLLILVGAALASRPKAKTSRISTRHNRLRSWTTNSGLPYRGPRRRTS